MQEGSQRDKIAAELKKELKRLQRLREQVGGLNEWPGSRRAARRAKLPWAPIAVRTTMPPAQHTNAATMRCAPLQVRGWATDINDPRLTDARKSVEREMVNGSDGQMGWEAGRTGMHACACSCTHYSTVLGGPQCHSWSYWIVNA